MEKDFLGGLPGIDIDFWESLYRKAYLTACPDNDDSLMQLDNACMREI